MSLRKTLSQFIQEASSIHQHKYDYSKVIYLNNSTKVIIICPTHGEFHQTPLSHITNKSGCPNCKQSRISSTMFERYGVSRALKHPIFKEKAKLKNIEKFGTENPFKNNKVREKWKNTMISKYGADHHWKNKIIRCNINKTMSEKYGTTNSSQLALLFSYRQKTKILSLLQNYEWLFEQYITQNKTASQIANELGDIYYGTIISHLRKYELDIKHYYFYSYKCIQWLEQIIKEERIYIQHAGNEGEFKIPGTRYKADGYCSETNTIYEFHGDYWHGNPNVYSSDELNSTTGKTMGELYQKTLEKEETIKTLGYNLIVIWEQQFNN
ncbi:MAG: DUF7487 domain-containing protein [Nitrososphaeraceae archaeon]